MNSKDIDYSNVAYAAIHPAIGIARVGNSPKGVFPAPQIPWPLEHGKNYYRDKKGRFKRQSVEFRIYGYDENDVAICELSNGNTDIDIEWTVHPANKKAAWYTFNYAMDIPEATSVALRNLNIKERSKLVIDPGPISVSGPCKKGSPKLKFTSGKFMNEPVYLGELETDDNCRLTFLGGHGKASSPYPGNFILGLGNQDGWYDDTCDGPVSARVTLPGAKKSLLVKHGWVVSAPICYTPGFKDVVTMWDCITDALIQGGMLEPPTSISFLLDIYPLFRRLGSYQWLNEGFNYGFGYGSPYPFLEADFMKKLSRNDDLYKELRLQIFRRFRKPGTTEITFDLWPWNYGDGTNSPANENQYLTVTSSQYSILNSWVEGNFTDDLNKLTMLHDNIETYEISAQPLVLDRAALDFCLGGPFRPGSELSWPMRQASMYSEPIRIRIRTPNNPEQPYGKVLTPEEALAPAGPLNYSSPGDLTRWMSVPWQPDLAACRYAYFDEDPYMPGFWPTRVPNQVLTYENYLKVLDTSLEADVRLSAYYERLSWFRFLEGGTFTQMNEMIEKYIYQGLILSYPGPEDPVGKKLFPKSMFVEEPIGDLGRPPQLYPKDHKEADLKFDYHLILKAFGRNS